MIADKLKLEGLIGGTDGENDTTKMFEETEVETEEKKHGQQSEITEDKPRRKSYSNPRPRNFSSNTRTVALNDSTTEGIDQKINENIQTNVDGSFSCKICGKISSSQNMKMNARQNMRNHMETHLEGITYSCQLCEKTFRAKNSLNVHKSQNHRKQH